MKSIYNWLVSKIPSSVRLTPKVSYEVVFIDNFPNDSKQYGETRKNIDLHQIVIKTGQSDSEKISTLIHELIHCIDLEYNIQLTETQVSKLEKALFKVFKLNNVFTMLKK